MWSPPDKNALPSPEEIKHATEAISILEDAIKDAFELIENTKLRITEMKRDLEERRSWIAPIRKVPTEVLADILLRTSEIEDLAPVKFRAVNRLWRNIILATPKAWSFIHLRRHYDEYIYRINNGRFHDYFSCYTNIYFERSKPRPLHLCLPDSTGFYSISIIKQQAHRIQCLTTPTNVLSATRSAPECQEFPHLQTLTLANEGEGAKLDTSFFTISRFPALQTLRWPRCFPLTSTSPTICPSFFPPLQHLSLSMGLISSIDILQSCAATLKSLSLSRPEQRDPSPPLRIIFPFLRCLTIGEDLPGGSPLVKATTPVLTSMVVTSPGSSIPAFFDVDMQTVTHMRWCSFQTPSVCTRVRALQVVLNPIYSLLEDYALCAKALKEIASAYPSLEIIELSDTTKVADTRLTGEKVESLLGEEFVKPMLLWTSGWQGDMPGYVADSCGKDMPCNEW